MPPNSGNTVTTTSSTVKIGTKANSVVNVKLPAACNTSTSLNRRHKNRANPATRQRLTPLPFNIANPIHTIQAAHHPSSLKT